MYPLRVMEGLPCWESFVPLCVSLYLSVFVWIVFVRLVVYWLNLTRLLALPPQLGHNGTQSICIACICHNVQSRRCRLQIHRTIIQNHQLVSPNRFSTWPFDVALYPSWYLAIHRVSPGRSRFVSLASYYLLRGFFERYSNVFDVP